MGLHFSNLFPCFLAIGFLVDGGKVRGGEEALEAFDSFLEEQTGGDSEEVLGMVGFFGEPLPPQWLILYSIDLKKPILHEAVVSNGQIRAERKFRRLPNQDLPTIPIRRKELKINSEKAFRIAESVAREAKVSFENAHYQLRCRDAGREPVWMIHFLGRAQVALGAVYLSARSGEVLRVSWRDSTTPSAEEPALETFASGPAKD